MTPPSQTTTKDHIVRLSLVWVLIIGLAIIILGFTGGILATQMVRPTSSPLQKETAKLVSTIQQVTISPNTSAAAIIDKANRSVVLIGHPETDQVTWLGTGLVITNDGLIVTTANLPSGAINAYDTEGRVIKVDTIGRDEMFGLTYLHAPQSVLVPLDLAQNDANIGLQALMISRSNTTFQPRIASYSINEYVLPPNNLAPGIQKLAKSMLPMDPLFTGSPIINDEGKVIALLLDPSQGTSLPISHLAASLSRITNNQRELNPFTTAGIVLHYTYKSFNPDKPAQFVAEITAIAPNMPAYQAGLQKGDNITAINSQTLDWQQPVVMQLANKAPLTITFIRNNQPSTVTISATPAPSPSPKP